jgi:DNA-binding PadR family transcriptional regulator
MDDLTRRVLGLFGELNRDTLDLHTLFEAGGNDPQTREQVFDVVHRLVADGLLDERGSDFYSLTPKGQAAVNRK